MTIAIAGRVTALLMVFIAGCRLFDNDEPPSGLRVLWRAPTPAWVNGTPALFGEQIVSAFEDRRLRAFRLNDGRLMWQGSAAPRNLHPLRVYVSADSTAIVTGGIQVFGFSAVDGQLRWQFSPPVDSSVNVTEGGAVARHSLSLNDFRTQIAVPAWGSTVSVLRTRDGATVWTWSAGSPNNRRHGANGALWCGDVIFASLWRYLDELGITSEHAIVALNAATGRELWRSALPFTSSVVSASGPMACDNDRVYAATTSGPVWALNRHTGAVIWSAERSRGYINTAGPMLSVGTVFVDDGINEEFVARRASDGTLLWRTNLGAVPVYSIEGGPNFIWFTTGKFVHILDAKTGRRLLREAPFDWSFDPAPLLLNERHAIIGSGSGLVAVALQ